VHAVSPGPLHTRALSGIAQFDTLLERAAQRSPQRRLVSIDDVGATAAFLASDAASALTGLTLYVDAGYQIMG
jgi:enoyl-[acyl-carrier protein] reductase I